MTDVETLAPGLLLAMPQLQDPNFHRSVILMVEHQDEGSLGLVLNKLGRLSVGGLLRLHDLDWAGGPDAMVRSGGPVMAASRWLIHPPLTDPSQVLADGTVLVTPQIAVSTSLEALQRIANQPPPGLLFVMGYAGWGPGQLVDEMVAGSWLHAAATPELVFATSHDRMWEAAMESIGVDPRALVPSSGVN